MGGPVSAEIEVIISWPWDLQFPKRPKETL